MKTSSLALNKADGVDNIKEAPIEEEEKQMLSDDSDAEDAKKIVQAQQKKNLLCKPLVD